MANYANLPPSESNQETICIAENGDVTFVVGPDGRRLRVHSVFVAAVSPVFKKMLGPNYEEGHQLAQAGEVEIALPDDDAEALEIVFNVIHGRNDRVAEAVDPGELRQVVAVADKYDCFEPLAFAIRSWFNCAVTIDSLELWDLAMAALLSKRSQTFAEVTAALVLNHAGSYIDLTIGCDIAWKATSLKAAAMLEEKRNEFRMGLIVNGLSGDWHCGSRDKKGRHRPDWLAEFVGRIGNWSQASVSSILGALHVEEAPTAASTDSWGVDPVSERNQVFKSISDGIRKKLKTNGGLCLRCVRTEEAHTDHA